MTITRRAVIGLVASGTLVTGLMVMPATAMLLPPQPDPPPVTESEQSPAMTAGRSWCACNDVVYEMLWID